MKSKKGQIISRTFTRTLSSGHELRYEYRVFESVLLRRDRLDQYLADCYEQGHPDFDEFESPSEQATPVAKIQPIDTPLIAKAMEANYRGKGNQQHDHLQKHFLLRDRETLATEVPLWINAEESPNDQNWCGHLDLLRITPQKVQCLDFKPNAKREKKAGSQVLRYMFMLHIRTGIPLSVIEGIYFDDQDAYLVNF